MQPPRIKQKPPRRPERRKWTWTEYFEALHEYLYQAKVIIYSLLLLIVALIALIRSQFPGLHPPWPVLRWVVTFALLAVLFVPPLIKVIRRHRE